MLMTQEAAQRVLDRYVLRTVVRGVCASGEFRTRLASLRDLTPEVMEAFGEAFVLSMVRSRTRVALFGGLGGKIKKLWDLFKRAPQLWTQIKEFLGIQGLTDIPKMIKEWAKRGMDALKKGLHAVFVSNPVAALYVVPHKKMPGVTNMLARIGKAHPKLKSTLDKVNTSIVEPIDKALSESKFLRTAARPVLAAIFIWVWIHVIEITWDLHDLVRGFTGAITFGELLQSLPESGIGFLIAALFPGLGTFALLPITIIARVLYLLAKKVIVWVKGKGFLVDWTKLGKPEQGRELVPVF